MRRGRRFRGLLAAAPAPLTPPLQTPAAKLSVREGETMLLEMPQVQTLMLRKVEEISDLLELSSAASAVLLRHFSWNQERMLDRYWADAGKARGDAGIDEWASSPGEAPAAAAAAASVGAAVASSGGAGGGGPAAESANPQAGCYARMGVVLPAPVMDPGETEMTCEICFTDNPASEVGLRRAAPRRARHRFPARAPEPLTPPPSPSSRSWRGRAGTSSARIATRTTCATRWTRACRPSTPRAPCTSVRACSRRPCSDSCATRRALASTASTC